jgi:DNA recombination protein RmuC
MANYLKYLDADAETDKEKYKTDFVKDVKARVKEIQKRGYIDPQSNTIDLAIIFIPNEQVYRFIHEEDDSVIDDALSQKVVICSPLTLYIVLSVIRQAARNFALEQSSREILDLLSQIKGEWDTFIIDMTKLGNHLNNASQTYEGLLGTRKRKLDSKFHRIDDLMNSTAATKSLSEHNA